MSLNRRLISTGAAVCKTDSHDIFTGGVALYNLDYDASDASGNYDGTPSNVTFGVGGNIKYGARFNGSSSTINLGNTNLGITDAANFTISYWFNTNSITANQGIFWSQNRNSNGARFGSGINLPSPNGGNGSIYFGCTTTSTIYINSGGSSYSANTWVHVVGVKSSTASTGINAGITLYVNGTEVANNASVTASASGSASTDNSIGSYGNSGSFFNGELDQVRIFSSALTDTQVSTLYAEEACVYTATANTADFPSTATAVAHYPLDNSAEDNHGNTYDGTESGDVEYRFGKYGQAAVLSGTSSYIDTGIGGSVLGELFSVSCWFKSSATGTYQTIFDNGGNTSGESGFTLVIHTDNTLKARFSNGDNNALSDLTTSTTVTDGNWHHCVLTYNNESAKIYLDNGTPSTGTNTKAFTQASNNLRIGAFVVDGTLLEFNGMLDQVRVYSTELTSDQVTELYNEKPETDTSNFKTVLYEGDGGSQYISNVGFEPDFVWIKSRDVASSHTLHDSVRGYDTDGTGSANSYKPLHSDATTAETAFTSTWHNNFGFLNSLDANGFTVVNGTGSTSDNYNKNNEDYVAWVWKGGGDAVPNTDGDITSQVSANTAAGFSIATYTGVGYPNASTVEVGHGLNSTPELVFIKGTGGTGQSGGAGSWVVGTGVLASANWAGSLYLNSNAAYYSAVNYFWNGAATDSVVKLKNDWFVNGANNTYVMYSWRSVSGYSKIGTYPGTSSTQTIVTGFKPSFVMIKTINTVSNWVIFDDKRPNEYLMPSLPNAKNTLTDMVTGFVSNGFTLGADTSTAAVNSSAANYLYMAFK